MKRSIIQTVLAASVGAAMVLSGALVQASEVNIAQAEEDQAFALGVDAYVWGYPLVVTGATALDAHAPFNTFGHVARLLTAADRDVVSSNVDTVYSSAFLDLKQGAALLSVPDTHGRCYSLMLEDAYTNVFGYVGKRVTGDRAGRYLITGPGWKGRVPDGVRKVIPAPTPLVWIIGRTLVDGDAELKNVRGLQRQYTLKMIPPMPDGAAVKERWDLTVKPKLVPVEQVEALDWKSYYHWLGQLMKDNPSPAPTKTNATRLRWWKPLAREISRLTWNDEPNAHHKHARDRGAD